MFLVEMVFIKKFTLKNTLVLSYLDESLLGYDTPQSTHGLFIDLQNFQSVGMGHLDVYCQKFNSDVGGIFLRCQGQSEERDNFSLVFMPQRLEVSLATIDDNEECFPAMVS